MQHYIESHREKKASSFLKTLEIYTPEKITMENICNKENLDLKRGNVSSYIVVNDYRLITINKNKDNKQQHFEFLHELAHNHFNHHIFQTDEQRNELEATSFAVCLAIPSHMLHFIDFNSSNIIYEVSDLFNIPNKIVSERLGMIKNNYIYYHNFFYKEREREFP
ncbi:ImmA/IrrE family metallo-endopeptidase [Listeria monocytogenes]|nr:ImmA/IrrE family metallo-endopeptidase [Listeria monocytogenes]